MKILNRRGFITASGAAFLGFPFFRASENPYTISDSEPGTDAPAAPVDEYIDPWLEIDTRKLAWNVAQVRKRVENRPIMAVVKCNGYGHGLVGVAKAFARQDVTHFAVVKVQEAVDLRKNGIKGEILNFGPFTRQEAGLLVSNEITQSVFSSTVDWLAEAARERKTQARVHLKVDTGLGRVGVPYDQAAPFIDKTAAMPDIKITGVFTTLTEDIDHDALQIERLKKIHDEAKRKGINLGLRHAASSLAVSNFPPAFLDMVRPGNCLYGIEKLPNLDIQQALTLKTRVILVKELKPGQTLGYHQVYKIEKNAKIATIPLGYSDGYPIGALNHTDALVHGTRCPLVGYMSANHVFIDVTRCSREVELGDEVVLYGSQKGEHITIGEVAKWGESSVYKATIMMNPLMPRVFIELGSESK